MTASRIEPGMPRAVMCSLVLQSLALGWGVLQFFFAPAVLVAVPFVVGLAFPGVLLVAMARRQNWARIAWLMLYVLAGATESVASAAILRHRAAPVDQASGGADVLFIVLDLLALALVFLPGSSSWFRGSRADQATRDESAISQ